MNDRRRRIIATATLLIGLTLVGCSASTTALDAQTSESWQTRVVAIADHAAAGAHAMALEELDVLEREAVEARESGSISAERAAIIQQSIALVRSDLESASADTTVPDPEPAQTEEPVVIDTDTDTGTDTEPEPGGGPGGTPGDGNSGKGNDGDKGKGNDGKGSKPKGGNNRAVNGKGDGRP